MSEIVLYHSVASRSVIPLWLLIELGVPYRIENTDIRSRQQKRPEYLKINPMGKVPALKDGDVVVTEVPAINLYLADKYGYGTLAPRIEDPARGAYLRWSVFSTAVFEPAIWLPPATTAADASGQGWGHRDTVIEIMDRALSASSYLLGEHFSAADVTLGGVFAMAWFNKKLPDLPSFAAYNARLADRPALKRAGEITWPPEVFAQR
jgi:glutathione S-transferase